MWALLLGRSVGDLGWNPKCYALNVWDVYRITQGRGPCIGHEGIREARGCGQGHRINQWSNWIKTQVSPYGQHGRFCPDQQQSFLSVSQSLVFTSAQFFQKQMLLYPSPSPFGIFCFQGKRIRILPHLTEKGYRISHRISRKTKCYNSGMANMGLLWGTREQEKWTSKAVPLGWNSLNYFPFLTLFAQGSNSHERTGLVWTMHPAC